MKRRAPASLSSVVTSLLETNYPEHRKAEENMSLDTSTGRLYESSTAFMGAIHADVAHSHLPRQEERLIDYDGFG